jgi:hypothetical protein
MQSVHIAWMHGCMMDGTARLGDGRVLKLYFLSLSHHLIGSLVHWVLLQLSQPLLVIPSTTPSAYTRSVAGQ